MNLFVIGDLLQGGLHIMMPLVARGLADPSNEVSLNVGYTVGIVCRLNAFGGFFGTGSEVIITEPNQSMPGRACQPSLSYIFRFFTGMYADYSCNCISVLFLQSQLL
jgi:hypothetical protein